MEDLSSKVCAAGCSLLTRKVFAHCCSVQSHSTSAGWRTVGWFCFAVLPNGYFSSEVGIFSKGLSTFTSNIMYSEAC